VSSDPWFQTRELRVIAEQAEKNSADAEALTDKVRISPALIRYNFQNISAL